MDSKSISKKTVITAFLIVPALASVISCWHLIKFFGLGDPNWLSVSLAFTFEAGSIASLIALTVLDKIKKGLVYFIFALLLVMQLAGNVYSVFDYVNAMLAIHPAWLANFVELLSPFGKIEPATYKFILAMIIGLPIPLISLSFLKSLVDYLEVSSNTPVAIVPPVPAAPIIEAPVSNPTEIKIEKEPDIETVKPEPEVPIVEKTDKPVEEPTKALWDDPWPELTIKTGATNPVVESDDDIAKYTNSFE